MDTLVITHAALERLHEELEQEIEIELERFHEEQTQDRIMFIRGQQLMIERLLARGG